VCVCVVIFLFFNSISIILIERIQLFFFAIISFLIHVMNFCALSCLYFFSFAFAYRFFKTQNYLAFLFIHIHMKYFGVVIAAAAAISKFFSFFPFTYQHTEEKSSYRLNVFLYKVCKCVYFLQFTCFVLFKFLFFFFVYSCVFIFNWFGIFLASFKFVAFFFAV